MRDDHAAAVAAAPRTVNTQSGQVRFRKVWRFEVEDMLFLPAMYWMPDEKKIKASVEQGIPIPGVRAWVEEIPLSY